MYYSDLYFLFSILDASPLAAGVCPLEKLQESWQQLTLLLARSSLARALVEIDHLVSRHSGEIFNLDLQNSPQKSRV